MHVSLTTSFDDTLLLLLTHNDIFVYANFLIESLQCVQCVITQFLQYGTSYKKLTFSFPRTIERSDIPCSRVAQQHGRLFFLLHAEL